MKRPAKSFSRRNAFIPIQFIILVIVIIAVCAITYIALTRRNSNISIQVGSPRWKSETEIATQSSLPQISKGIEVTILYNQAQQPVLSIQSAVIRTMRVPRLLDEGQYVLQLADAQNSILSSVHFDIPKNIVPVPPLPGEKPGIQQPIMQSTATIVLTLPYTDIATQLRILDVQNETVSEYTQFSEEELSTEPSTYKTITGDEFAESVHKILLNPFRQEVAAQSNTRYFNVAIIGHGYTASTLSQYHLDVNTLVTTMLKLDPFKTRKSQIRFSYVDNTTSLGCRYSGRAIVCNDSTVMNIINTSKVPYDRVYVVVNSSTYGGAYDYSIAAGYNGYWAGYVFVHEAGHLFSHLTDEYYVGWPQWSNKNCWPSTPPNPAWNHLVSSGSYYKECDMSGWYRTSQNSIMRSMGQLPFNAVSQIFLNETLDQYAGPFISLIPTLTLTPTVKPTLPPTPKPTIKPTATPTPRPSPVPTAKLTTSVSPTPIVNICAASKPDPVFNCTSYKSEWVLGYKYISGNKTMYLAGTKPGQFNYPFATATDPSGNLYVSDTQNARIQKFTSNGQYVMNYINYGLGATKLNNPRGITFGCSGSLYVVDYNTLQHVKKYKDFVLQSEWGKSGSSKGQLLGAQHIATDMAENVYVSDITNRITKFDSRGNVLTTWGSYGSGNGQFFSPHGIAVDGKNNVYVVDTNNHRVQVFSSDGTFLSSHGSKCYSGIYSSSFSCTGQFFTPEDIAIDPNGNIYVLDSGNNRIQKFDSSWKYLTSFGKYGIGVDQFNFPKDITVDIHGNIYITDRYKHRIQKFSCSN